ncbi:hypothetical protein [uncultured Bacteroides sp.]|nr:hypothetical protein [uncultured Bacteroides sp.]
MCYKSTVVRHRKYGRLRQNIRSSWTEYPYEINKTGELKMFFFFL